MPVQLKNSHAWVAPWLPWLSKGVSHYTSLWNLESRTVLIKKPKVFAWLQGTNVNRSTQIFRKSEAWPNRMRPCLRDEGSLTFLLKRRLECDETRCLVPFCFSLFFVTGKLCDAVCPTWAIAGPRNPRYGHRKLHRKCCPTAPRKFSDKMDIEKTAAKWSANYSSSRTF